MRAVIVTSLVTAFALVGSIAVVAQGTKTVASSASRGMAIYDATKAEQVALKKKQAKAAKRAAMKAAAKSAGR